MRVVLVQRDNWWKASKTANLRLKSGGPSPPVSIQNPNEVCDEYDGSNSEYVLQMTLSAAGFARVRDDVRCSSR